MYRLCLSLDKEEVLLGTMSGQAYMCTYIYILFHICCYPSSGIWLLRIIKAATRQSNKGSWARSPSQSWSSMHFSYCLAYFPASKKASSLQATCSWQTNFQGFIEEGFSQPCFKLSRFQSLIYSFTELTIFYIEYILPYPADLLNFRYLLTTGSKLVAQKLNYSTLYTLTRTIVWYIEWWTQVSHNGICQDMHWKAPSVYKTSILCLIFEIIPSTTQLIDTSSIVVNGFLLSPKGPCWACLLDDLISTDYRILFLYLSQKNDNNNHQSASHLDLSCEVLFLIWSLEIVLFSIYFFGQAPVVASILKSPLLWISLV